MMGRVFVSAALVGALVTSSWAAAQPAPGAAGSTAEPTSTTPSAEPSASAVGSGSSGATAPVGVDVSPADAPSPGDVVGIPPDREAIEAVAARDRTEASEPSTAGSPATDEPLAVPAPRPDCSTPRRAAVTFLTAIPQGAPAHPEAAVLCFDWDAVDVPVDERFTLARDLKMVLDVGGYFIQVDDLPDTADVAGENRVPLIGRLPEVWLHKTDRGWVFSPETIEAIPDLYAHSISVDVEGFVDTLPGWMRASAFGVAAWQVAGLILGLLLGLLARYVVARTVASQGTRLLHHWGQAADASVLAKAANPVGTLVMTAGLGYLLPLLRLSVRINRVGTLALRIVAAVAAVMLLYRLVDVGSDVFARRAEKTETKLDDQLIPLVRKTLKVFVSAVGVIFVLQNMDVDVSSLLAGASLGGLAFTLAARDTVANLFGSISIFADNPFQVGDWVIIDGHEGVVTEVGMRSTRIRTFYNSIISIPNSVVANAVVDNYSSREYRRCMVTLGLTYDTKTEQMNAFVEGVRAILKNNPFVRKDAYEVHFRNFGESGLEVLVYFFFKVDSWTEELRQRQNIFLEIMRLAEELHVAFAFPTRTLHIESAATQQPVPPRTAPPSDALKHTVEGFAPGGSLGRPAGPKLTHGYYPTGYRGNVDDA